MTILFLAPLLMFPLLEADIRELTLADVQAVVKEAKGLEADIPPALRGRRFLGQWDQSMPPASIISGLETSLQIKLVDIKDKKPQWRALWPATSLLVPRLEAEHGRWVRRAKEVFRPSIELQRSLTLEIEEDIRSAGSEPDKTKVQELGVRWGMSTRLQSPGARFLVQQLAELSPREFVAPYWQRLDLGLIRDVTSAASREVLAELDVSRLLLIPETRANGILWSLRGIKGTQSPLFGQEGYVLETGPSTLEGLAADKRIDGLIAERLSALSGLNLAPRIAAKLGLRTAVWVPRDWCGWRSPPRNVGEVAKSFFGASMKIRRAGDWLAFNSDLPLPPGIDWTRLSPTMRKLNDANLSWETFREAYMAFTPQDLNALAAGGMEGGSDSHSRRNLTQASHLFHVVARLVPATGESPMSQTKRVSELPREERDLIRQFLSTTHVGWYAPQLLFDDVRTAAMAAYTFEFAVSNPKKGVSISINLNPDNPEAGLPRWSFQFNAPDGLF